MYILLTFEVAAAQTSGLVNLVFSCKTVFIFECEHLFFDKTIVISEPAVASPRPLGPDSKLHSSNMPRMLNKHLTQFMQGLS